MKYSNLRQLAAIVMVLLAGAVNSNAQDVTLTDSASVSGTGTFNIKGNIVLDTTVTSTINLGGNTRLVGADSQKVGLNGRAGAALAFDGLSTDSTGSKLLHTPVTVKKHIALNQGALEVNGNTLTIDSATSSTAGTLSAGGANDVVVYDGNSASAQAVLKANYKKLLLTNAAPKVLHDTVTADTLTHSGGGLGVNHELVVNAVGTIGTIDSATAGLQFNGSAANSIQTIASTATSASIVNNSSDSLTINAINGNAGTIATNAAKLHVNLLAGNSGTIKTNGAGALHFVRPAVNSGIISDSGVAGTVTFDSALTNNVAGTVRGGQGGVTFGGKPVNAGSIAADAGTLSFPEGTDNSGTISIKSQAQAAFNKAVNNTGTLAAQDTATATFDQNFASKGTLAFTGNSTAKFQGATDTVPSATFANLLLDGTNNKHAADTVKLTGNLTLNKNLAVAPTSAVEIIAAGSRVIGAGEVDGSVKRNHAFTPGQFYAFNKDTVGLAIDSLMNPEITLTMLPDSSFLTPAPSAKYINRRYAFNAAVPTGGAKITGLSLTFTDAERSIVGLNESKLGVRYDVAGSWKKASNPLGYVRTVDTTNNIVTLASLATPIAGITELGLMNTAFVTIADNGHWETGTTWDEGSSPTLGDDAEVNSTGVVVGAPSLAASVTVNPSKSLLIQSTSLTVAGLFDLNGALTVDAGTTMNLSNNLRLHGPVTNNGTINVGQ